MGYPKPLAGQQIYVDTTVYTVTPGVSQPAAGPAAMTLQLGESINNWSDHM
jgi:hypothetical protein